MIMVRNYSWPTQLLCALGLVCVLGTTARAQGNDVLVVTALQATYSLTSALTVDTSIRVENAPSRGTRMAGQERAFASPALDALFREADAVVTIARVWNQDQLYRAARARNIRVVPIDAARPWDEGAAPVGLRRRPCSKAPWSVDGDTLCVEGMSPFIWLSIANAIRMAENIAADLARLVPQEAAAIDDNLTELIAGLRTLKAEHDTRFAMLTETRIFALADEFVYLFGEMGVFVDGTFTKEDVLWSEADLEGFEQYLAAGGAPVVVHKWEPNQPILDALERAGATLVVLNTADPGIAVDGRLDPTGYMTLVRQNLEDLFRALSGS